MEWQSVLITLVRKNLPKNSSQTFKPNTFVPRSALMSRFVNVLKVPGVNLELWDDLLDKVKSRDVGFQAFQKGLIKDIVPIANLASKLVEAKKNKGNSFQWQMLTIWLLTR